MNVTDGTHPQTRWRQSLGEEIANGASHGVGLLAAAIGTPILLEAAWARGSISFVVGTAIFAATMLLLPHGLNYGRVDDLDGPGIVAEYLAGRIAPDGRAVEWTPQAGPSDLPCFVVRSRFNIKGALRGTVRPSGSSGGFPCATCSNP